MRDVQVLSPKENSLHQALDSKTVEYHISWEEPKSPNGLIYFYTVSVDQDNHNGPKDERCVGHDMRDISISLLPRTNYRLRIITYTIARLNREYDDYRALQDEGYVSNTTNSYYQMLFMTIDSPSKSERERNEVDLGSAVLFQAVNWPGRTV